ncbi:MAG: GTPase HflX, partial [Acidimicrobiia bacterium]|nr:GTPase HflX [Acidimicrobiia bacterium]
VNKTDIAPAPAVHRLLQLHSGAVAVSARTGDGLAELGAALVEALERTTSEVELRVPYDRGDLVAAVHRVGDVLKQTHEDDATVLHVRLPTANVSEFEAYRVG